MRKPFLTSLLITGLMLFSPAPGPLWPHGGSWDPSPKNDCCLHPYTCFFLCYSRYYTLKKRSRRETVTLPVLGKKVRFIKPSCQYNSDGSLREGDLAGDVTLPVGGRNIAFSGGHGERIFLHPGGTLWVGTLEGRTEFRVGSRLIPFGRSRTHFSFSYRKLTDDPGYDNIVSFHDDGSLASGFISQKETFTLRGNVYTLPARSSVGFHKNGTPSRISLDKGVWKDDRLSFSFLEYIHFHDNGAPWKARLAAPLEMTVGKVRARFKNTFILGITYGAVSFYPDGSLHQAALAEPAEFPVGKRRLRFDNRYGWIEFYPDGNPRLGYLPEETVFTLGPGSGKHHRFYVAGQTGIIFHPEGGLMRATASRDTTLSLGKQSVKIAKNSTAYFRPGGELFSFTPKDRYTIQIGGKKRSVSYNTQIHYADYGSGTAEGIGIPCSYLPMDLFIEGYNRDGDHRELCWVRFKDYDRGLINAVLFIEKTVLNIRGKRTECAPFQWVPLEGKGMVIRKY